ncbi:IS3 family transposase [Neobacillus sp. SCS-31]
MESFFGHLKDEVNLASCRPREELGSEIDNYITYYNFH